MQSRFKSLFTGSLIFIIAASVQARSFKTMPDDKRNLVQFTSQATMESFTGRTSKIQGQFDVNLDSLLGAVSGRFEVDATSLDTGIKMRNTDMKTKFLETAKFPKASFTVTRIISADKGRLQAGESAQIVAEGELTVHGTAKLYQIPMTLRYVAASPQAEGRLNGGKGNLLLADAEWKVKLADHDIKTPQMFFMRVADEQTVKVDIALTDQ